MDNNNLAESEYNFFSGIRLGPNGTVTLCPILVGIPDRTGLELKNCDVYLDEGRLLEATNLQSINLQTKNLVTQKLSLSGTLINKITADDIRDMVQQSVRVALRGKTEKTSPQIAMAAETTGFKAPTYYSQLGRLILNAKLNKDGTLYELSADKWIDWIIKRN